jgi:GNAT superfamily N-acetyltransferase
MNEDARFSVSQFRDAWRLLCGACPGYQTGGNGDLEYIFSGLPIPFFNVALVKADNISGDGLAGLGREASTWAANTGAPWMFIVTHEALAPEVDAASALESCGLIPLIPMTGMRAERIVPASRRANGLQLDGPSDDAACASIIDVNSAAYGMDLAACKPVLGKRSYWASHVPVLGRVDGTPVACAAVFNVEGYRYVALVATTPGQQRRGYADAVMRQALDVAAATYGETPTTLHATDAGRPVYARMGYEPIAAHTAFIDKRFLEGHA